MCGHILYAIFNTGQILNENMQGAKLANISMYNMVLYRWVLTRKSFAILLTNSPWSKPLTKVLFRHRTVINQLFHRNCSQIMLWMEGSVVLKCKVPTADSEQLSEMHISIIGMGAQWHAHLNGCGTCNNNFVWSIMTCYCCKLDFWRY